MPANEKLAPLYCRIANVGGIVFALFLSVFALDVFSDHQHFWNTIVGFFIHLIPTFTVLLLVFIAQRRPLVGAIAFMLLALAYLFFARGRFNWTVYAAISGPLAVIGLLYFMAWRYRKQ